MQEEELESEDLPETIGSIDTSKNRYVVRDEGRAIDQYHGPCSLYALCREFCEDPIFKDSWRESGIEDDSLVPILLKNLCTDASREHYMDLPSQLPAMTLPPRQFLSTVAGQFFKTVDHTTDIFVQSNFLMQMDRIYAQALRPVDEAWAACFNMVALLAMGKDQNGPSNTASVQSFILAFQIAINSPRVLLVPRLVNVQALALLVSLLSLSIVTKLTPCSRVRLQSLTAHRALPNLYSHKRVSWPREWASISLKLFLKDLLRRKSSKGAKLSDHYTSGTKIWQFAEDQTPGFQAMATRSRPCRTSLMKKRPSMFRGLSWHVFRMTCIDIFALARFQG